MPPEPPTDDATSEGETEAPVTRADYDRLVATMTEGFERLDAFKTDITARVGRISKRARTGSADDRNRDGDDGQAETKRDASPPDGAGRGANRRLETRIRRLESKLSDDELDEFYDRHDGKPLDHIMDLLEYAASAKPAAESPKDTDPPGRDAPSNGESVRRPGRSTPAGVRKSVKTPGSQSEWIKMKRADREQLAIEQPHLNINELPEV